MMTRKHFERIAEILNDNTMRDGNIDREVVSDLAIFFGEDNPNFDIERFLKAARKKVTDWMFEDM